MTAETVVKASDFARNFGRYREQATEGTVVRVTNHGRTIGAFLSARQLEEYRALKERERQNFVVGELPDDVVESIRAAEYDM